MSERFPTTPAVKLLDSVNAEYKKHTYDYKKSGAVIAAEQLGVDKHVMIKTLVMEDENGRPFIVLMHGDKRVSLKKLAKSVGAKNVSSCSPKDAQRHTGYTVGGISPFGTRKKLNVYIERTILGLPSIYINGGRRGFLLEMKTSELVNIIDPKTVDVAV